MSYGGGREEFLLALPWRNSSGDDVCPLCIVQIYGGHLYDRAFLMILTKDHPEDEGCIHVHLPSVHLLHFIRIGIF